MRCVSKSEKVPGVTRRGGAPVTLSIVTAGFERTCRSVLRRAPPVYRDPAATPWSLGLSGTFSAGGRPDARVFV